MGGKVAFTFFIGIIGLIEAQPCACGVRCQLPTTPSIWPIAVHSYTFGTSQTFGQDPRYFPYNVLGAICSTATPTSPCADPCQVVSLGKGGYVTLEFDPPIADGSGPDFIVFENGFTYGNGQVFDEWMIVHVSQDGERWVTFPHDSLTGAGLAGRNPTGCQGCVSPINWQDPAQAGGDAFDLSVVGLPWVKYVRLEDATHWQPPDRLSADLDGVVAIHQLENTSLFGAHSSSQQLLFRSFHPPEIKAWNLAGQAVAVSLIEVAEHLWTVQGQGTLFLLIQTDRETWRGKICFLP